MGADYRMNLPEGFILDDNAAELPEGFIADESPPQDSISTLSALMRGLKSGIKETGLGLAQMGAQMQATGGRPGGAGFTVDELRTEIRGGATVMEQQQAVGREGVAEIEALGQKNRQEFAQLEETNPISANIGKIGGAILSTAFLPGGTGGSLPARMATTGIASGVASGIQYTAEDESRALKTAEGLVLGAGLTPIFGGAGFLSNKAFSAVKAKIPADIKEILKDAAKFNIPIYLDDVTGSIERRWGQLTDRLGWLGTGAGRKNQIERAEAAARKFRKKIAPDIDGDAYHDIIDDSFEPRLKFFKKRVKFKYDKASEILDPRGTVNLYRMEMEIEKQIRSQRRQAIPNEKIIKDLEEFYWAMRGNFSATRMLRSELSDNISDFYRGANSAIGSKGVQNLQAVKNALEQDMKVFATSGGDSSAGYKAWKAADEYYASRIIPFTNVKLRRFIKAEESEEAFKYLISAGGNKKRTQRIYQALPENGKRAVRAGLVDTALQHGISPAKEGTQNIFVPKQNAKKLLDFESIAEQFMRPSELKEYKGLIRVMSQLENASQYAVNPPTGARLVEPGMFAASFFAPKILAAIAAGGTITKFLFQNEKARDLLLKIANTNISKKQLGNLTTEFSKIIAREASLEELPGEMLGGFLGQENREGENAAQ